MARLPRLILVALLAAGPAAPPLWAALSPQESEFFEKEIRPLLSRHCYECHSRKAETVKGGLLLDTAAGVLAGGESGEAIVPGDPEESLLVQAVRHADGDLQMPPKYQLKAEEIAALEKWIALGAPDPRAGGEALEIAGIDLEKGRLFWAFQQPQATPGRESIDAFIHEKRVEAGLNPVGSANRAVLLRRASFDLTGLPPAPEAIEAFVADPRPDREAFAARIDDLLASEAFGERWGRHWLDIVRYAESMGRTRNYPFPYAWRYRDYVIDAFNADKPYDAFLREQIAGDLLPTADEAERDRLRVATGFLALGSMDLNERDREQYRMDVVDEQIDVTGRAILGLTTGCARCHDHKFDPIPQSDYYALAGIFRSTQTLSGYQNRQGGNRAGFSPDLLVELKSVPAEVVAQEEQAVDPQLQRRLKNQERQLAQVNRQIREAARGAGKGKAGGERSAVDFRSAGDAGALAALRQRQQVLQKAVAKSRRAVNAGNQNKGKRARVPRTANHAMGVAEAGRAEDCRVNVRGEARNLGDRVPRGFLSVLSNEFDGGLKDPEQSGRLELARWLTSPDNPLTARVLVNRLWHHLMGTGLVRTVDNFGAMGEMPSHPALLDFLALRFVEQGWSLKAMIREIMLSGTYRLASAHDEEGHNRDPENRLFWRANVRRLQAEPLRDALLAISGQLDPGRPEGSPVLYQSTRLLRRAEGLADEGWRRRRSVYLPVLRGFVPEFFQIFDFAEPTQVIGRRDVTTVSTQALFFMNSPFVLEQARHAADRLVAARPAERVDRAYQLCFGRLPSPEERSRARSFLESATVERPRERWASLIQALFASAEFRYLQ